MTEKNNDIVDEYIQKKADYEKLGEIAGSILSEHIRETGIEHTQIEHRLKTVESLEAKLYRKGKKYCRLQDITDVLGLRIITLYSDNVDKLSKTVEENFNIDKDNSIDKRKSLSVSEFGYLSMHYICSLPENKGYPEELCGIKFEIQIRSSLQHIWSEMNHDIGYKSTFALPRACMRSFSKLASLMEIADEMACNLRDDISKYIKEVHEQIAENRADDIEINKISINEYVKTNNHMSAFFQTISKEWGIEVSYDAFDTEIIIHQLTWLGFSTLGDIQKMFERCHNIAMSYVHYTFEKLDIDIISSSAGLRFMFNGELLLRNESRERIEEFCSISIADRDTCRRYAADLLNFKETL